MSFINGPNIGAAENVIQRRNWNYLIEAISSISLSTTFLSARISGGGKYSLNGLTWSNFSFPASANMSGVAQNENGFIAFPFNGVQTYVSVDGINWSIGGLLPSSANWYGAIWNGTRWLAFGDFAGNSRIAISANGLVWTASTNLAQTGSVIWDGSKYVAMIGNAPYIYTSIDGVLWSSVANNINSFTLANTPANIHYFNGVYFMSGSGFDDFASNSYWMLESNDLITWVNALNDGGAGEPETSGRFADNGIDTVVCTSLSNDRVYVRIAGVWSKINLTATPLFFTGGDLNFKQGLFALVSSWGTTYNSPDGLTWSSVAPVGNTSDWLCVT